MLKYDDYKHLEGTEHVFPDGIKLRIIQIKQRETALWVLYEHVFSQHALPRRFSETLHKFLETYGHLFNKGS